MRKLIILLLISGTFFNCSYKVEEITSYEYRGAWYWVLEHKENATEDEVKDFVNRWANPNQTSYFFVYSDTISLLEFKKKDITFPYFTNLIINNKPSYGFYKMANDSIIYDDAVWLIKQSK